MQRAELLKADADGISKTHELNFDMRDLEGTSTEDEFRQPYNE